MSFNVLIVDDSNAMRSVVKKIINISGFKMDQCYEAANGKEALELLKESWVDIILSDLNMPEMNGLELLANLKKDDLLKEIPVIIITTDGSEQRRNLVSDLGANGFIKKPFVPEEVRTILYDVLGVTEGGYATDQSADDGVDF
jgi:two-component system chemotaxis response regulator CheY